MSLAGEYCSQFVNEPPLMLLDIRKKEKRALFFKFELINGKPVKELLLLLRVITVIQSVLKMRDKIMMVMMSASVEGIPLSLSLSLCAHRTENLKPVSRQDTAI